MKNSKKGVVAVTARDEKLFRYLFVNKAATVEAIGRDIFGDISIKTVHRRLLKLSSAGLVEAFAWRERGNKMIYSLTKKGFREYIAEEKTLRRVQLKSDCLEHDLTLLEIKRIFKGFGMVQGFYSENLFRSGMMDDIAEIKAIREVNPDAIVKVRLKGESFFLPLEYEASAKYSKRNDKILAKYYTSLGIAAVIFISKNDRIEKRIVQKEMKRKTKDTGKMYYGRLEEVLGAKKSLSLKNVKEEALDIC